MRNIMACSRRWLYPIALGVALALNCAAQTRLDTRALAAEADKYLNGLVAQRRFGGAILVARDGEVLLRKGYGMENVENDVPNSTQTKFPIGSITKQFTAVAILMLQERGKLSVQDSICKYIADCPAAWQPMTIEQLLTHTSGLPDSTSFRRPDLAGSSPAAGLVELFKKKELILKPGERFGFSNPGYIFLGHIIEKVSGQSYETFLRENIFEPLKLANSGYDKPIEILKHRAAGYVLRGTEYVNAPRFDIIAHHAASALYSTVDDLYLWDRALYTGKLLSQKTLAEMMKPRRGDYGYGVFVEERFNLRRVSHAGELTGFNSYIARYPAQKAVIIVLSNYAGTNPLEVGGKLTNIYLRDQMIAPVVDKLDMKTLEEYTGRYMAEQKAASNFIFDVTLEDGHLWVKPSHFEKHRLIPFSQTEYYDEEDLGDTQYTFTRDEKGKVNGFIHREPTETFTAHRMDLPPPSLKGNTTFRLKGYPDASIVALAGSFNNWHQTQTLFVRQGDEWVCRIDLPPGKSTYKFVIDGDWITDPGNLRTENDGNGNINSVLIVR
jgi:CubicO group peptidase (beta-lactamase class C family)